MTSLCHILHNLFILVLDEIFKAFNFDKNIRQLTTNQNTPTV